MIKIKAAAFFLLLANFSSAQENSSPKVPAPTIISRQAWGAAPPISDYDPLPSIYRGTIHHTAANRPTTLEGAVREMQGIQAYHELTKKWADIGYHFVIDGAGRIFEGRPLTARGAHAKGPNNDGNVGIALMGNFDKYPPTPAQWVGVKKLALWLSVVYSIEPESWKGHKDFGSPKSCPGYYVYHRLPVLRKWLAQAIPKDAAGIAWNSLEQEPDLEKLTSQAAMDFSSHEKPPEGLQLLDTSDDADSDW